MKSKKCKYNIQNKIWNDNFKKTKHKPQFILILN